MKARAEIKVALTMMSPFFYWYSTRRKLEVVVAAMSLFFSGDRPGGSWM